MEQIIAIIKIQGVVKSLQILMDLLEKKILHNIVLTLLKRL